MEIRRQPVVWASAAQIRSWVSMLSATMPPGVRELTRRFLIDPVDVRLIPEREDATVAAIRQSYLMVHPERKIDLLFKLLEREQPARAIVFCRTKRGADRVGALLRSEGLKADTMHGNLSQAQRNRVLDRKSTRLNSSHLKLSRMPSSA